VNKTTKKKSGAWAIQIIKISISAFIKKHSRKMKKKEKISYELTLSIYTIQ